MEHKRQKVNRAIGRERDVSQALTTYLPNGNGKKDIFAHIARFPKYEEMQMAGRILRHIANCNYETSNKVLVKYMREHSSILLRDLAEQFIAEGRMTKGSQAVYFYDTIGVPIWKVAKHAARNGQEGAIIAIIPWLDVSRDATVATDIIRYAIAHRHVELAKVAMNALFDHGFEFVLEVTLMNAVNSWHEELVEYVINASRKRRFRGTRIDWNCVLSQACVNCDTVLTCRRISERIVEAGATYCKACGGLRHTGMIAAHL